MYSEQSYQREKKTFTKKLDKQEVVLKKLLWHLGNETFSCETDATKEVNKIIKKFPYHSVELKIVPITKHDKSGRPKKGAVGGIIGYQVQSEIVCNSSAIEEKE